MVSWEIKRVGKVSVVVVEWNACEKKANDKESKMFRNVFNFHLIIYIFQAKLFSDLRLLLLQSVFFIYLLELLFIGFLFNYIYVQKLNTEEAKTHKASILDYQVFLYSPG